MDLISAVKKAKRGSNEAFVNLIKNQETSMYRVAKAFLKSDIDCADVIQETILKSYSTIATLNEPAYFKTWLIKILINECNRMLKQRKKIVPMEQIVEQSFQNTDFQKIEIVEAVDALENDLRLPVILHYYEDLPLKEIAQVMELPEGTVKSRLSRARTKLAQFLGHSVEGRICHGQ